MLRLPMSIELSWRPSRKAKDIKLYKLLFRSPLPVWNKQRLVIIGDAAHPMLPCKVFPPRCGWSHAYPLWTVQGQAGAQAIEDGAALGAVFSNFTVQDSGSISERLLQFEVIRRNRASVMQLLSNAGQDEAAKVRESVLPYMPNGNIPSKWSWQSMINMITERMQQILRSTLSTISNMMYLLLMTLRYRKPIANLIEVGFEWECLFYGQANQEVWTNDVVAKLSLVALISRVWWCTWFAFWHTV